MKKYLVVCALLPFVLGMTSVLPKPEPKVRGFITFPCFTQCQTTQTECFDACKRWSFFRKGYADLWECESHCRDEYYFCEMICKYEAQDED